MQTVAQQIAEVLGTPTGVVESMLLFDSLVTVNQANNVPDSLGQVDLTFSDPANYTALVTNIPCMRAPSSASRVEAGENKGPVLDEATNVFHVLLDGYFPQIPEAEAGRAQLQAVIDGAAHEILGVESSSQLAAARQTRLEVRQVGL